MARPRKTSRVLRSLSDCDDAMCALKIAVLRREQLEAARDKAVAGVVEKYDPEITEQVDLALDLQLQLRNYYMAHLDEVEKDGKKSVLLAHGVMGRRSNPPALALANKAWTWASAKAAVAAKLGQTFLRFKDPEIDKDRIKEALREGDLNADQIAACGLVVKQDEEFYAEPARTATTGADV
jgi:phage host-nuclease inhibitor protein Gam